MFIEKTRKDQFREAQLKQSGYSEFYSEAAKDGSNRALNELLSATRLA